MAGHSRPKDGVASLAYVPAISLRLVRAHLIEIAGTSPAMTAASCGSEQSQRRLRVADTCAYGWVFRRASTRALLSMSRVRRRRNASASSAK